MTYVFMKYPERQIRNIVINTDWLAKSIYNIVKKFLPKRTLEKMAFAGKDPKEILEVLSRDIDISVIPKKYGGQNDLII
ncbi:unnamed protein product [Paramecium primaurelia]|uniref:CRAL-TRIO domain-containing protein n=1 Tax=Paramecium primaurelia TaxID=5886 RepID=A0A8S1MU53_PARPR|nr:unnamed protein product [Paramecium primaurelia]